MEYNKKEQLLDKVSGLKYMNPSGQGFYHNKALDTACVHIKEFFDSEFVPEVPQYVANWYEINKFDLEFNIWSYITYDYADSCYRHYFLGFYGDIKPKFMRSKYDEEVKEVDGIEYGEY